MCFAGGFSPANGFPTDLCLSFAVWWVAFVIYIHVSVYPGMGLVRLIPLWNVSFSLLLLLKYFAVFLHVNWMLLISISISFQCLYHVFVSVCFLLIRCVYLFYVYVHVLVFLRLLIFYLFVVDCLSLNAISRVHLLSGSMSWNLGSFSVCLSFPFQAACVCFCFPILSKANVSLKKFAINILARVKDQRKFRSI